MSVKMPWRDENCNEGQEIHSSNPKICKLGWNVPSVLQHLDIRKAVTGMPWCAQAFVDIWYVLPLNANFLTFIVFCHKHNVFFNTDLLREHIYYTFHVFPSHFPLLLGFLGLCTGPGHAVARTHPGDTNCPVGSRASISVLKMLHPTTWVCTSGFVFSSMVLKNPFKSPSNRCLISAPLHSLAHGPTKWTPPYRWPISSSTFLSILFSCPNQIGCVFPPCVHHAGSPPLSHHRSPRKKTSSSREKTDILLGNSVSRNSYVVTAEVNPHPPQCLWNSQGRTFQDMTYNYRGTNSMVNSPRGYGETGMFMLSVMKEKGIYKISVFFCLQTSRKLNIY